MSNTNTGGPAFPSGLVENAADEVDSLHKGMTLRDYFAAKAMQALIQRDGDDSAYGSDFVKGRPVLAYEYSDAMLKAREA